MAQHKDDSQASRPDSADRDDSTEHFGSEGRDGGPGSHTEDGSGGVTNDPASGGISPDDR